MQLPILLEGQVYYNPELNEYLVITRKRGETISYQGVGFKGMAEDEVFLARFQPVDPIDLMNDEKKQLLSFCRDQVDLKVGFIQD